MADVKKVSSIRDDVSFWYMAKDVAHGRELRRSGLDVVVTACVSKDLRAILSIMSSFWALF